MRLIDSFESKLMGMPTFNQQFNSQVRTHGRAVVSGNSPEAGFQAAPD
jgi:hypothetical protein